MSQFYSMSVMLQNGETLALSSLRDKVVLVANVASQCGFTPQYTGLQKLYEQYKDQGLVVLGFPCNQFGSQEPGSDEQIRQFCNLNFGVTFPLTRKTEVNGDGTHPVFAWLKKEKPGLLGIQSIKWNFTKFLVGRNGDVLQRYAPTVKPQDIEQDIKDALK
ncbi:glutathione peroxidase [Advenella kashmirensis W13003]|uniref:Glutathione peroxidase n=1 Tax=Advenella kashmirensis W13003 TaxID=1424334 RepID=V8QRM0_9BURK|nr:glutathione peroxidase [Advenella kashmirensis]ETF01965.1 glutathione peroxidase [Advenella kashmirensis W13003]